MSFISLKLKTNIYNNKALQNLVNQFDDLLIQLQKKDLPTPLISEINNTIQELNNINISELELKKLLKKKQTYLLKLIEKQVKIVPQFYYRNLGMALGMSAFGIPMGVIFGLTIKNMAFIGIGLPIGMAIGIAVGTIQDKKAYDEGRQLAITIKY